MVVTRAVKLSLLSLQPLMVVTRAVKLSLLQQSQASVPLSFIIWHLSTIPLNVIIASTQAETSVLFGSGMFSVEKAVFTLASQPLRSAARAVKFFAPLLVVDPWHDSAALFPPPDLMILWAVAAKIPFFPFFFSPVLLAAMILPCCFR